MRGPETEKSHKSRSWSCGARTSFYERYMGGRGLDVGYRGSLENADPVLETAIGIDIDYPGYDGLVLPFQPESQDYVFSSHCLEHLNSPYSYIREWFNVLKLGGYLILIVPHQHLYEKKQERPSRYNEDHKRFYTPAYLLQEVEIALPPNTYRIRHLQDNDIGYDYSIPPEIHANGCYEIELVIQKIKEPTWKIE